MIDLAKAIQEEKTEGHSGPVFTCPLCGVRAYSWNQQTGRKWRRTIALHMLKIHDQYLEGLGFSKENLRDEIDRRKETAALRKQAREESQ